MRAVSAQVLVPVFMGAAAVIGVLAVLDVLLVRIAHRERLEDGQWLFERAHDARAAGRRQEALELFRSAYNHAPGNLEYRIGFIRALRVTGREAEARTALESMLERVPANGPANIELARSLASSGRWRDAAWYYRRGLYGEWRSPPDVVALRFELADLMAANGAYQELLSELLLLDVPPVRETQTRRLARLFLTAQSWTRAEELYRTLLRNNSSDGALWAGLGRAQFGNASYVSAERSLRRAAMLIPEDTHLRAELELVTNVTNLDPTARRLLPAEKHRRAHELASAVLAAIEVCAPGDEKLAEVRTALGKHRRGRNHLAFAEADLDLVEQLWTIGQHKCGGPLRVTEPVRLLIEQLQKQPG
jgi:tetratricopeptide (TPR) repeat protein